MLRSVRSVELRDVMLDSMADTAPEYVKDQKDQLYAGFDSKGQRLKSYASELYAEKKNQMNSAPGFGNPDLKLTGAFYDSIRADIDNDGFQVSASDEKANMLEEKYGKAIYTLGTDAKSGYLTEELAPVFIENVVKKLNESAL